MELSMTMRTVTADLRWGYSVFDNKDNFACDTSLDARVTRAAARSHASWNTTRSVPPGLAVNIAGYFDSIITKHENLTLLTLAQASRKPMPRSCLRLWPGGILFREVWGVSRWSLYQEWQDLHGYQWRTGLLLQWRLSNSNQTMSGTSSVIGI